MEEIKVGTDITECYINDSYAYYVTKVINQKHIFVKHYEVVADHSKECEMGHQNWLYFKTLKEANHYMNTHMSKELLDKYGKYDEDVNESSYDKELVFRYNHWYEVYYEDACGHKYDKPKYHRIDQKLVFGLRRYHYCWEF